MTTSKTLPEIGCACASVRRAARLITQLYSREMGTHIEPGQFSLLLAIEQLPGCTQTALGRALGFDKTTISRNLQVLKRNGWIEPAAEPVSGHRLTATGTKILNEAKPGWERAQAKFRDAMTDNGWQKMLTVFNAAAQAALKAG